MDAERTSYQYRGYIITTVLDDGAWWAKVRAAEKDVGGDQAVLGGPWRIRVHAKNAAQAFCDRRPTPGASPAPR